MTKAIEILVVLVVLGAALASAPGLPDVLDQYMQWTRLNADTVAANPSGAHPQPKNVYVNLEPSTLLLEDGSFALPFSAGTAVAKERNDPERLLVDRIYLMMKGSESWSYSVYDRRPDGTFAGQELGTENFCADCHRGASATDFVFTTYERRLGPGVRVCAIVPGNFSSAIMSNAVQRFDPPKGDDEEVAALWKPDADTSRSRFPGPEPVAEACFHALFDENPLSRYLVVPIPEEADRVLEQAAHEWDRLNRSTPYAWTLGRLWSEIEGSGE